jgi:hypothetical protein
MRMRAYLVASLFVALLISGVLKSNTEGRSEKSSRPNSQIDAHPTNCEDHIAILEAANHDAGKEGVIIILARLGSRERRSSLNRRRLYNARAYLTEYLRARTSNTIVTAEGERTTGYARIEVYVGGKLYHVFAVERDADFIVGSCEPEELDDSRQKALRMKLYPWRDRTSRRH